MPGGADGIDLARAVREQYPHARIALMSGLMNPHSIPSELYDTFLPKPVLDVGAALVNLVSSPTLSR
jgi:hypothetical protein